MLRNKPTTYENFGFAANTILNNTHICVTGNDGNVHTYRPTEIEFYYNGEGHKDHYTHGNADQLTKCKFYFHKFASGSYKSGTFKGMDITLSPDGKAYYGVLIRSVMDVNTGEFIEGPCRVVNKFLCLFGFTSVAQFVKDKTIPLDIYDTPEIHVIHDCIKQDDTEPIYKGPRIGLNNDKYPDWRKKNYRCAIYIKKIKKEKKKFIVVDNIADQL